MNPEIWHGKRVLVTGHTGFKGSWLTLLLQDLGAQVVGLSLPPTEPQSLYVDARIGNEVKAEFFQDIRDEVAIKKVLQTSDIDYVFHLAAQAYVRKSVRNPIECISTNVTGTANVLISSLSRESVLGVTIVTTDKVYENLGAKVPFKENDKLGGRDPYSASKAAAEHITAAISSSNNPFAIPVTTVRAGNVIGGGDWGEERLIPDLVRALKTNSSLSIRNPHATRPWQHVLDCLYGYLLVAQSHLDAKLDIPKSVNFGPTETLSVIEIAHLFEDAFERKIDFEFLKSDITESEWLALDSSLALTYYGWQASFSQKTAVRQTAGWYSNFENSGNAQELMHEAISTYKVGKW